MVDAPNTPTDSPGAGTYSSTQSVTLSDATAQFILYTTNGSTPACPATGTLYSGAISVSVTTTIKAIGCNGVTGGGVLTSVYTISSGPALVQHTNCGNFSTTTTCTFGSNVTSGNAVLVLLLTDSTGATCVSGTGLVMTGATFTQAFQSAASGGGLVSGFYALSVTGGVAAIAMTCNSVVSAVALEVSGVTTLDKTGTATGNSGAPSVSSASITGTAEYVAAIAGNWNAYSTWTHGTGYTIQDNAGTGGGGTWVVAVEDNNIKTGLSGAQTAAFTMVSSATWSAGIMTFK